MSDELRNQINDIIEGEIQNGINDYLEEKQTKEKDQKMGFVTSEEAKELSQLLAKFIHSLTWKGQGRSG